jgi:hypothetical protein
VTQASGACGGTDSGYPFMSCHSELAFVEVLSSLALTLSLTLLLLTPSDLLVFKTDSMVNRVWDSVNGDGDSLSIRGKPKKFLNGYDSDFGVF